MKIPFYNDSEHYKTVGTQLIPPGETREVDATMLPGYAAAELALDDVAPVHIVDSLLAGSLHELLSAIPVLAREDLELLGEREQAEGRRKDVLSAVSERLLTAASEALGLPGARSDEQDDELSGELQAAGADAAETAAAKGKKK